MLNPIPPIETKEDGPLGGTILNHPAFATITVSEVSGGNPVLFGSETGHMGYMRISIQRANVRRTLSNDWIHGSSRDTICELSMSHAQFAQMITRVGKGDGTPCTLNYVPAKGTPVQAIPGIERLTTKQDIFKKEIRDGARERVENSVRAISAIEEAIERGAGKKELRELVKEASSNLSYLPGTLHFVVEQAEEALEKATAAAKIDIESFISLSAQRLGFEQVGEMARALKGEKIKELE